MKKFLSTILAAIILSSLATFTVSAQVKEETPDLGETHVIPYSMLVNAIVIIRDTAKYT